MCRTGHIKFLFQWSAVQPDIAIWDNRSSKRKSTIRLVTYSITKFMILLWWIDKIIFISNFSHGRSFKKRMFLEWCSFHLIRNNMLRLFFHGQHIVLEHQHHRSHNAVRVWQDFFSCTPKHLHLLFHIGIIFREVWLFFVIILCTIIESYHAIIIQHRRVKAYIPHHRTSIFIAHMP